MKLTKNEMVNLIDLLEEELTGKKKKNSYSCVVFNTSLFFSSFKPYSISSLKNYEKKKKSLVNFIKEIHKFIDQNYLVNSFNCVTLRPSQLSEKLKEYFKLN